MIDAFKGANGKICGHSDMGTTYNPRTGKTFSHRLCNKRDLNTLPYSEKELSQQSAFKTRSAVISATCKALSDEDRKALILVRNERKVFSIRQLVEGIFDKETQSIPAAALAELIALGKKEMKANPTSNPNANPGGDVNNGNTSGSGSSTSGGGDNTGGGETGID